MMNKTINASTSTTNLLKGLEFITKNKSVLKSIDDVKVKLNSNKVILEKSNNDLGKESIITFALTDYFTSTNTDNGTNNDISTLRLSGDNVKKVIKGLKSYNDICNLSVLQLQESDSNTNNKNLLQVSDDKKSIKVVSCLDDSKNSSLLEMDSNLLFSINPNDLITVVNKVKCAVATDETRPILTGLHITNNFIEACDGYRIHQSHICRNANNIDYDFTVNMNDISMICDILKKDKKYITDSKTDVKFYQINTNTNYNDSKKIKIELITKDYTLNIISTLLQGEYLNTRKCFKDIEGCYHVVLDNDNLNDFREEVKFIHDMIDTKDIKKSPIKLSFINSNNINNDKIIKLDNMQGVESTVKVKDFSVDGKVDIEKFEIGVNPKYLLDMIDSLILSNYDSNSNNDEVVINFSGELKPVSSFINNGDKYLLLPVKLKK